MGVRVWSYGATLTFGYREQSFYGGVLFDAGQLVSRGEHVSLGTSDHSWYEAAGLRFAYCWQIAQSWAMVPRIDGLVALSSLKLRLNGLEAYSTPRYLGRFGLALEYAF